MNFLSINLSVFDKIFLFFMTLSGFQNYFCRRWFWSRRKQDRIDKIVTRMINLTVFLMTTKPLKGALIFWPELGL